MVTLIVGAGFSKWAANLPVAKELFDFAIEPFGVREEKKLSSIREIKASWDLDHPTDTAEAFIDFAIHQNQETSKLVVWYVVRRLSEPYIWKEEHAGKTRRHVLMLDEHRKDDRPGVKEAQGFFLGTLDTYLQGVITTNYDLLIEYALSTKGFNYGVPGESLVGRGAYPVSTWLHPVVLTGQISLAKVHGSISWDSSAHYTDGRRGLTGNALILAPVPDKKAQPELARQWQLAASLLAKAEQLVVFGFAFNKYDAEMLDLFRIHSSAVKSVLHIDIKPNNKALRNIWPHASIATLPPPPESERDIREWLKRAA
ncbi:MAG: SIR2 family protein [Anaerolineaceae bacterium]